MAAAPAGTPQWPPTSGKAERGPPKSGFKDQTKPDQFYFFVGENFVVSKIATDKLIEGPKKITEGWRALAQCGFNQIDAILPNPSNLCQAYFFYGEWCALINVTGRDRGQDFVVEGPVPIGSFFPDLLQVGFKTVDSCITVPGNWIDAYFFKGDQYVRISVFHDKPPSKVIANRPSWSSIQKSNFAYIDTIVLAPESEYIGYYFCGDKYSKIEVGENGATDKLLGGPGSIAPAWPGLASAKFY